MPEVKFSKFESLQLFPTKLSKFVNLHGSPSYFQNMFGEQFAYGQREILLKYCGLDFSTQLLGNLQHGILANNEAIDFRTPRYTRGRKSSFWVYSKETESLGKSLGFEKVVAIGAPWLYLRDSVNQNLSMARERKGILVMPAHTTPTVFSISTKLEKRERAAAFRQIIGSQEATVCLHATDYCDPETTESFIEEGFAVTCIGTSSLIPAWSQAGNRVRSLFTLMKLMETHESLLTDDFGTHLFYAVDMGMQFGIYPQIRNKLKLGYTPTGNAGYNEPVQLANDLVFFKKSMPEAINNFTDSTKFIELANKKLGREAVLSPQELCDVLLYKKNVFPVGTIQPW